MSGIKAFCKHCGHTWIYTGPNDVTSCPVCAWRVRVRARQKIITQGGDALLPEHKRDRLI